MKNNKVREDTYFYVCYTVECTKKLGKYSQQNSKNQYLKNWRYGYEALCFTDAYNYIECLFVWNTTFENKNYGTKGHKIIKISVK